MSSRWTPDHGVVLVEVACGLGIAGYFAYLGLATGQALPFVLAGAALVVLAVLAPRRWRRAGDEHPMRRRARPPVPAAPGPRVPDARPELSDRGRRDLEHIVAVLAAAGLLAPRVPDPRDLVEAVADGGEPVTTDSVLAAVAEADYWHPGFRPDDHLGAVAFTPWKGEQLEETLRAEVADLARLVGDDLTVELADLRLVDEDRTLRTRMTLVLGGRREVLDYTGAHKWTSTVLHVAVARALAGTDARLAWFGHDQGVWIAALRDGVTVEALNAELGTSGPDTWQWVDEQEPLVAGEL